ncbi:MAG TPA: POTRA domain-containing protein [Xanthobacteraceae bacterium]|jgi:hemolysin activation/secretion protein
MLAALAPARAQNPAERLPGQAGERFQGLPAPVSQPGGPRISLPSTVAPAGADRITLTLNRVIVLGSTIYRPEDLEWLYGDLVGRTITLQAVYDIAARITAKYGADGYVLSRAVIPPQELDPQGATVRIQIVEGYIDSVVWPAALARYHDFFSYYTERILAERPTNIRTLERYLLLAGDLPGLKFKSSLKASATTPGAATLVVEVVEKPVDLIGRLDNRGTKVQGPLEYLGSVTLNNWLGVHDAFNFTYAGVPKTEELQYYYGQYRQVLTPEGLTAFFDASASKGRPLTAALQTLGFRTNESILEGGLLYPFIRQRELNLSATALYYSSNDQSTILGLINSDVRLRGLRFRINADAADPWAGIDQLYFVATHGFQGAGATASGLGLIPPFAPLDYTKFEATFTRLQSLPAQFSFLLAAYGQWALNPLFMQSPEPCGYGGRVFGRAFDPSQMIGDNCAEVLGELRWDLPLGVKFLNLMQLYGYGDHGWLHNLDGTPIIGSNGTSSTATGSSAGGGLRVGFPSPFSPDGFLTADLSANKALEGPRDDWRFFFIVTGRY